MAMTKKQAAVWFRRESTTRTRSLLFHHDVILILVVSIMFCHQSTIDAFCSNGNPNPRHYCCGVGRKTDGNLLYQRPCQFQFHKKQHSLSTIHHTPTTKTVSLQGFFGGMFGGGDDAKGDEKDAVLVTYDIEQFDGNANDNDNDIDVKFESLSDYITNKWAMLFVTGTIPLTTPVRLSKNPTTSTKSTDRDDDDDDDDETVEDVAGCRLIFQKVDTGYKSSKEEDNATGGGGGDDGTGTGTTTSVDRNETKQGGVEIVVEKISSSSSLVTTPRSSVDAMSRRSLLRVRARRCEIDDDTMIKEMSEDIIVEELRKAIDVWKKERVV